MHSGINIHSAKERNADNVCFHTIEAQRRCDSEAELVISACFIWLLASNTHRGAVRCKHNTAWSNTPVWTWSLLQNMLNNILPKKKKKRAELIYLLLISFCSLYTQMESVCQGKCTNCNSLSLEIKHYFPCLCLHLSLSLSTSGPLLLSVTNTSGFNRKEIQNVSHCLIVTHHPNLQPPRCSF